MCAKPSSFGASFPPSRAASCKPVCVQTILALPFAPARSRRASCWLSCSLVSVPGSVRGQLGKSFRCAFFAEERKGGIPLGALDWRVSRLRWSPGAVLIESTVCVARAAMAELDAAGQQPGLQPNGGQELPNGVGDQMGSETRQIAGGNGSASVRMHHFNICVLCTIVDSAQCTHAHIPPSSFFLNLLRFCCSRNACKAHHIGRRR